MTSTRKWKPHGGPKNSRTHRNRSAVLCYNCGEQTMRPVSVDTRDKCSAMTVNLKVINPDVALINRNSAMMPFQSSLYHVKTNFLS